MYASVMVMDSYQVFIVYRPCVQVYIICTPYWKFVNKFIEVVRGKLGAGGDVFSQAIIALLLKAATNFSICSTDVSPVKQHLTCTPI